MNLIQKKANEMNARRRTFEVNTFGGLCKQNSRDVRGTSKEKAGANE